MSDWWLDSGLAPDEGWRATLRSLWDLWWTFVVEPVLRSTGGRTCAALS